MQKGRPETPAEIRGISCTWCGCRDVNRTRGNNGVTQGMKILGISCITNMAAGILKQTLNHER